MDQLSEVVHRAHEIAAEFPKTQPNAAYGDFTFWTAVYMAVLEISSYELAIADDERDMAAHLEFRSHNAEGMRDLILLVQKYVPDFNPTSEDRPQVLRRQVATAIVELTNPRLPLAM